MVDNQVSPSDRSAPWFSSLVKDVASVLGKSPTKRRNARVLGKEDASSPKRNRSLANNDSESDSDYYVDFDEDEYYNSDAHGP